LKASGAPALNRGLARGVNIRTHQGADAVGVALAPDSRSVMNAPSFGST
jgi:hypothetical protein